MQGLQNINRDQKSLDVERSTCTRLYCRLSLRSRISILTLMILPLHIVTIHRLQKIMLLGARSKKDCDFEMTRLRSLDIGSQTESTQESGTYHPPEYENDRIRKYRPSYCFSDFWAALPRNLRFLSAYSWKSRMLSERKLKRRESQEPRSAKA